MSSDQVFRPELWYFLLALLAVSLPVYVFSLWKSPYFAAGYLVFVVFLGIYLALFSARNFGGAFGAGMVVACLSAFLVPISLIIWFLLRRPFGRKFEEDHTRQRYYAIGAVVIVFVQLFPLIGSYGINTVCFRATQNNAKPLITATEDYFLEYGQYPSEIHQVVPLMAVDYPSPACFWLKGDDFRNQTDFVFEDCGDGTVLLTNYSMDGTSIERYNFATGNWSAISFFDGSCAHLQ